MAGALCLLQGNPAIFLSVLLGLPRPWGPRGSGHPAPCQVSAACSPHSVLGGWRNGRRDIPGVPQAGTLCYKGDQGSLGWRFQLSGLDSDVPAGLSVLGLWRQAGGELHPRTGKKAVSSCREPRPCPPVSSALGTVAWLTAEAGGMKRTQRWQWHVQPCWTCRLTSYHALAASPPACAQRHLGTRAASPRRVEVSPVQCALAV